MKTSHGNAGTLQRQEQHLVLEVLRLHRAEANPERIQGMIRQLRSVRRQMELLNKPYRSRRQRTLSEGNGM